MAKKTFKNDMDAVAAGAYLSIERGDPEIPREYKSKRVNLIFRPSVVADLYKCAAMQRTTLNGLLNDIAEQYVKENADLIKKYNDVFPDEKIAVHIPVK